MRRTPLPPVVEVISNPAKYPVSYFFIYFFLITIPVGLAINGLSAIIFDTVCQLLQTYIGFNKLIWQIILTAILFSFLLLLAFNIAHWFRSLLNRLSQVPLETKVEDLNETFPGLIVVASKRTREEPTPAEIAILHHSHSKTLQHCWLICTKATLGEAEQIANRLSDKGVEFHYGEKDELKDPNNPRQNISLFLNDDDADDPDQIQKLIDAIYADALDNYGLDESQIIADYTGGTKSMTAGVILACGKPSRRLQYLSQIKNKLIEVKISYKIQRIKSGR